ncbi:MAG TPA: hypothetical protein VHX38_18825, partial [Pseudonocardiaceae bacterium]|nr:hypothetical protein [Pseudonocardiaceae bacterium]
MPGIAPQLAARRTQQTRGVVVPAAPLVDGSGPTPGVPILLNSSATLAGPVNLVVEFAWGAQITTPATPWTWTEVTADVQYSKAISITIGRSDESANPQPAQAAFTLLNTSGAYSYGPASPNYPNVKRNVPCRIS